LAPLSALGVIALFAWPYYRDRTKYKLILTVQAVTIIAAGLLSQLIGPLFKPMALESFDNVNGRTIVSNLYDAFLQTFNAQSAVLINVGLAIGVVAIGLWIYPIIREQFKQRKSARI
jgi:hypothetical protein